MKIFLFLAGLGLLALLAYWFNPDQIARRALQKAPRRRIRDLREDEEARLIGVVEVKRSIRAPISGRSCAYFRIVVQEQDDKHKTWQTVLDAQDGFDFLVKDESGEVLVRTDHVQAVLEQDRSQSSGILRDTTPELEEFLRKQGETSKGFFFNRTLCYREGVLEAGERVTVAGVVHRTKKGQTTLVAPEGRPLLISDETDLTVASPTTSG